MRMASRPSLQVGVNENPYPAAVRIRDAVDEKARFVLKVIQFQSDYRAGRLDLHHVNEPGHCVLKRFHLP
jgi:hypothetical protein